MRQAVLSIIWETMTSSGEEEDNAFFSSPSSVSPTFNPPGSPLSNSPAGDIKLESEVRAIIKFLCNPNPAGSRSIKGTIDSDAGLVQDVSYLLAGLLRRKVPAPGLYPALHSLSSSFNSILTAASGFDASFGGEILLGSLFLNQVADSDSDDQRSIGLQLISTYLARQGAHSSDLTDYLQQKGNRSGSSSEVDHHDTDKGSVKATCCSKYTIE